VTEIELRQPQASIEEQMAFARAVVARPEGAARSLLPEAYRDNPGNVLIAVGLGQSMGLSPAESLYRIDVIQGKPCAGAELIAANVRKAGHKLRVQGDESSCTATIIRADDPEFPFTVTRDLDWAKGMGLTSKDNYKKQPGTMLQWRAISAVARLACPEALYGVSYTPDELFDQAPARVTATQETGLAAALASQTSGAEPAATTAAEPNETNPSGVSGEPSAPEPDTAGVTRAQLTKIAACMSDLGITQRKDALTYVNDLLPEGREIGSRNELTKAEAHRLIEALEQDLAQPFPEADVATGEIVEGS